MDKLPWDKAHKTIINNKIIHIDEGHSLLGESDEDEDNCYEFIDGRFVPEAEARKLWKQYYETGEETACTIFNQDRKIANLQRQVSVLIAGIKKAEDINACSDFYDKGITCALDDALSKSEKIAFECEDENGQ